MSEYNRWLIYWWEWWGIHSIKKNVVIFQKCCPPFDFSSSHLISTHNSTHHIWFPLIITTHHIWLQLIISTRYKAKWPLISTQSKNLASWPECYLLFSTDQYINDLLYMNNTWAGRLDRLSVRHHFLKRTVPWIETRAHLSPQILFENLTMHIWVYTIHGCIIASALRHVRRVHSLLQDSRCLCFDEKNTFSVV